MRIPARYLDQIGALLWRPAKGIARCYRRNHRQQRAAGSVRILFQFPWQNCCQDHLEDCGRWTGEERCALMIWLRNTTIEHPYTRLMRLRVCNWDGRTRFTTPAILLHHWWTQVVAIIREDFEDLPYRYFMKSFHFSSIAGPSIAFVGNCVSDS